jgi:hypothetical protein
VEGRPALVDPSTGLVWRTEEEELVAADEGSAKRPRLAGHKAYWFGWYAFFPDTTLYGGCTPGDAAGQ